jgi:DNA-binding Lrp family transcriptional regulator
MVTKPQDIVVVLKLVLVAAPQPSYAALAADLGLSASEVHAAVRRLIEARLLDPETRQVHREALHNFLIHGVPHVFPARLREVTRGLPTAWAAPVMGEKISAGEQIPPVWPDPDGQLQGASVQPLYSSVPFAARRDPALYDLLALVDTLRLGRARERAIAEKELRQRLLAHATV